MAWYMESVLECFCVLFEIRCFLFVSSFFFFLSLSFAVFFSLNVNVGDNVKGVLELPCSFFLLTA